ncbi:MAG: efflux RND transporter periplasmic adaptor subunit [Cyclobacteriaceae bacterium]|nr:efflux RND transporter periplasmic adaptor subunit [Cytophagales bacterium]MBX2898735.1 efflux RND transporter periplasmic adaptor subunit [Cyclobacteriaceae bacterium]
MAKQVKKKSNRTLYILMGAAALLVVLLIVGKTAGLIGKPKTMEVEVTKAKKVSIVEKVSASGTVQPVIEVKLAPEVSGEITDLNVEDGDSVKTGQLLVKIRPDVWISQLERSEASLNQQKANLESARASYSRAQATFIRSEQEYKRQEKLWNEKVISEADWQLAQQNFKVASNDLKSAEQSVEAAKFIVSSTEAGVKESRENVRRTSVMAPMSGVVSKLNVKRGERVVGTAQMAGTEMLRIADLNKMEVRVNVNENDIVRVHLGDSAIIDVDAYGSTGKQFKGIVTNIANTARDKVSADAITEFEVRILILQSSYLDLIKTGNKYPFRPGMTASVDVVTTRKDNVLSVPLAAVTTRAPEKKTAPVNQDDERPQLTDSSKPKAEKKEDKVVVFVNENGVAKMIEVKTGISDYDNIEIVSGLTDSATVITGPFLIVSKRLKDGEKINVKKDEKKNEKSKEESK